MIKPTVGRVVWVRNRPGSRSGTQPEAALIAYVHSDTMINVGGFNADGTPFSQTSCRLVQDDSEAPPGVYAEWMPFQKGQAAKTEELERQAAGK